MRSYGPKEGDKMILRQRFTDMGLWGAGLFVGGPFVFTAGYLMLASISGTITPIPVVFMVIGTLCFFLSLPMMLIGRELVQVEDRRSGNPALPASPNPEA